MTRFRRSPRGGAAAWRVRLAPTASTRPIGCVNPNPGPNTSSPRHVFEFHPHDRVNLQLLYQLRFESPRLSEVYEVRSKSAESTALERPGRESAKNRVRSAPGGQRISLEIRSQI